MANLCITALIVWDINGVIEVFQSTPNSSHLIIGKMARYPGTLGMVLGP